MSYRTEGAISARRLGAWVGKGAEAWGGGRMAWGLWHGGGGRGGWSLGGRIGWTFAAQKVVCDGKGLVTEKGW